MRLSDVMGHAGLSGYAEVALILFLAAFIAVVIRTLRPGNREEMEALSRLPLEDDRGAASSRISGDRDAAVSHGRTR